MKLNKDKFFLLLIPILIIFILIMTIKFTLKYQNNESIQKIKTKIEFI